MPDIFVTRYDNYGCLHDSPVYFVDDGISSFFFLAKNTKNTMREWEKFSTNYIGKKAEVITFVASKSRTFSLYF